MAARGSAGIKVNATPRAGGTDWVSKIFLTTWPGNGKVMPPAATVTPAPARPTTGLLWPR